MRQRFVFRSQRRAGDLGDHEAGVHPAVIHQEGRQLGQVAVDQQRHAAFGQRADFGNGQGQVIGGKGHRFGVEIAAGQDVVVVAEYQRIVRNRVGFHFQHAGGVADLGQAGTHHLRLAAQAVRVLHLAAVFVRVFDFAVFQQRAVGAGGVDLAGMAAHGVDARIKRGTAALRRFHRHRAGHHGRGEQVFRRKQAFQGKGGGGLRAVQQGQAFFRGQGNRLQTSGQHGFTAMYALAVDEGFALADQHRAHVRQRGQVAGGTDRTLLRNHRVDAVVEQCHQGFDHLTADAGEATRQRVDFQCHHQTHGGIVHRRANASCVRQHDGALQQLQFVRRDAGIGQQAKAGVDAIGGAPFGQHTCHGGGSGVDAGVAAGIQLQLEAGFT